MTLETIVIWWLVGLCAGWLASAVVGGGMGVVGDIVVGIAGAFIGGCSKCSGTTRASRAATTSTG